MKWAPAARTRGERAVAVHVDYSEAFDSFSHIYLFNSLKKAGASSKSLQLYKANYQNAKVAAKIVESLSALLGVGRGALEGDINSPMYFNIGLEAIFREADEVTSQLALTGGIKLRDTAYDKVVFADDVTATGTVVTDVSHRLQILEHSSEKAGLHMFRLKSCTQHIGYSKDAPAITADDIQALKLKYGCPRPWCTQRFASTAAVRAHCV